jgi:hypothetical protein
MQRLPHSPRIRACLLALLCLGTSGQAAELVSADSDWRWLGRNGGVQPDPAAWRQVGFDASGWDDAPAPFWYGDVQSSPGTQLTDMQNGYLCLFLRRHFTVANPSDFAELRLGATCDDGFIAWINGRPPPATTSPTASRHG